VARAEAQPRLTPLNVPKLRFANIRCDGAFIGADAGGRGGLKLAMTGGDLSAILVNPSGLQFGNALLPALGLPQRTQIEWFIGEAGLERGARRLQSLALDTTERVVTGTGGVDLRDERVDLRLRTEAKHFSIGSLPAPINIAGTLKRPIITLGILARAKQPPGGRTRLRGSPQAR
jgi:hypothetical protein